MSDFYDHRGRRLPFIVTTQLLLLLCIGILHLCCVIHPCLYADPWRPPQFSQRPFVGAALLALIASLVILYVIRSFCRLPPSPHTLTLVNYVTETQPSRVTPVFVFTWFYIFFAALLLWILYSRPTPASHFSTEIRVFKREEYKWIGTPQRIIITIPLLVRSNGNNNKTGAVTRKIPKLG